MSTTFDRIKNIAERIGLADTFESPNMGEVSADLFKALHVIEAAREILSCSAHEIPWKGCQLCRLDIALQHFDEETP